MDKVLKWIILTNGVSLSKARLDELSSGDLPESDPRFKTSEARRIAAVYENPPVRDVKIICYGDSCYPKRLAALPDPPATLYVRGDEAALNCDLTVSVVGSREATEYGISATRYFSRCFCDAGIVLVSGGAKGVDSECAKISVQLSRPTVAVLGCGVDIAYPSENRFLFDKIIQNGGCLVSEYFFSTPPLSKNFPKRNRIIAALGDYCLVTEAAQHSGTLITANYVQGLNKPVYAVPGDIFSRSSAGANQLIQSGAAIALSGSAIAAELKLLLAFSSHRASAKFTPAYR